MIGPCGILYSRIRSAYSFLAALSPLVGGIRKEAYVHLHPRNRKEDSSDLLDERH